MLGDGTCHFSIKLVILELGLWRSFILNEKLHLFLDLELGRWTCHSRFLSEHQQNSRLKRCFRLLALPQSPDLLVETQIMRCICEPEPVTLKLGLRPSFILNKKLCLFLDLEAGMLDLSLQHWT